MNSVHVVTKAFLFDLIRPETSAAIYRFIERSPFRFVLPKFLSLIFHKQEESLHHCRGIIVPSEGMKRVLVSMYPDVPADKIHVFPWGSHSEAFDETLLRERVDELRREYADSRWHDRSDHAQPNFTRKRTRPVVESAGDVGTGAEFSRERALCADVRRRRLSAREIL